MTQAGLDVSNFQYLDWNVITQAEQTILHDILYREPESIESQHRLFEFLKLKPGEMVPPIPVFRLPEKGQEETTMTHMGNMLNLQQMHAPSHSVYSMIPVVTSEQNGHPLAHQQQVWVDTQGGGQAPPPGLGGAGIRGSYPGTMVSVPPNYYQQMIHHQAPQQYGTPGGYMTHMGVHQHYPPMPLTHIPYQSPMPYPGDEHVQSHQPNNKVMDSHSNASSSPMGSGSSNLKGLNRKGNSRPPGRADLQSQQQLNQYTTLPYYPGMGTYGTVYYANPALAANVTGQPIILPPSSQPIYPSYTAQQHIYTGDQMDHQQHTSNLIQEATAQQQVPLVTTTNEPMKSDFVPDSNGPLTTQCPAFNDTPVSNVLPQPCSPPPQSELAREGSPPELEQKLGFIDQPPPSPPHSQQTVQNPPPPEKPIDKDDKENNKEQDEIVAPPPLAVNGPIKGSPTGSDEEPQQTSTPARASGRKIRTEEKTTSTEFPQLPPTGVMTNGFGDRVTTSTLAPAAAVAESVHRSWASIASAKNAGSGAPVMETSVSRPVPPLDAFPHPSTYHVPSGYSGPSGVGREPHLAFDPACLSNENDPIALNLGEFLVKYQLNHHCLSITPRGLVNQSNFCYINATLQSLLACPPFLNLFRSLEKIIGKKLCKATPILQSVYDFVMDFEPISRLSVNNKSKRPNDAFVSGPPLDPIGIRRVLSLLDGATFKVEGRQEDAEEFLSHLLNGLHDEMVKTIRWYEAKRDGKSQSPGNSTANTGGPAVHETSPKLNGDSGISLDEDADWQVMGPKNKGSMTRKTEVSKSPISEMFVGQMSSLLNRGNTPKTTTLQPFFTLQLDIQDDNIHSVKDALEGLSTKEEVSGSSTTGGAEAPMWKQLSLEFLPIILVIHLKRFVYDKNCSKIFKLDKRVDFGVDLVIEKDLLSVNCKSKTYSKQRSYKLFAAVYHDGEEAHKGHYIADTFHPSGGSLWGQFGWVRYDDSDTKSVNENQVLTPQSPRVPYLLYYRRVDTLSPGKKLL